MNNSETPRWGKSIIAVLAGIIVGVALSLGTDQVLHMTGVYPPWGKVMSDRLFVLATAYRLAFGVLAAYVTARFAPSRPMLHALVGGTVGFIVCVIGAVTTWNMDIGPHWYSVLLAVTALPCAWIGGRLWQGRFAAHPAH